jgi:hypothetical protein
LFLPKTLPPSSKYIPVISAASIPIASPLAMTAPVLVPPIRSK